MAQDGCDEPQLRHALGLYLVGRLPDDEVLAVERHLGTCDGCQMEADRIGEAVMMLALLSDTDRDELMAEFGSPRGSATSGVAASSVVEGAPAVRRPPAGGPPRPRRGRRRQPRLVLVGAGLVVVLFVLAGVVGQPALTRLFEPDPPTTLVANAADQSTGATLTVTVTGSGDEVDVRAAVTGLTVDAPYRFYVTDVAGRGWELARITGQGRLQEITASCPVPLDRIARFSVTAGDGALAVAAPVHRSTSPPD